MLLKARDENIFILWLPPHCTHKLQPLDVGVLGPLQAQFTDNIDAFVTRNGCGVGKKEFIEEYVDAREKAITKELVQKAFEHCGIVPFNPGVFTSGDFAPAQAFSTDVALHFPSSYPTDPLTAATTADTDPDDADFDSDSAIETATCTSDEADCLSTDVDGGSCALDDEDSSILHTPQHPVCIRQGSTHPSHPTRSEIQAIESKINRRVSCKELSRICATLLDELKAKDDEIDTLRAKVEQANAHAIILKRHYTPLITKNQEKKESRTGTLDPYARVINTDDAIEQINAARERETLEAQYLLYRHKLMEQQGEARLAVWRDIPAWSRMFYKEADRRRRKAVTAAKRAEREQLNAEAKAAKDAQKAAEKAARDAAKQAAAAKKRDERQAEKARKEEAKRVAAEEKAMRKPAKRQRAATSSVSGTRKKNKVSDEAEGTDVGQENNAPNGADGEPHVPLLAPPEDPAPCSTAPQQPKEAPRPKPRYTAQQKNVGTNISNELTCATRMPPADQHHTSPTGVHMEEELPA